MGSSWRRELRWGGVGYSSRVTSVSVIWCDGLFWKVDRAAGGEDGLGRRSRLHCEVILRIASSQFFFLYFERGLMIEVLTFFQWRPSFSWSTLLSPFARVKGKEENFLFKLFRNFLYKVPFFKQFESNSTSIKDIHQSAPLCLISLRLLLHTWW